MKLRTVTLLAALPLAGLAVAALAQGGVFDPGPVPPLGGAGAEAVAVEEPVAEEQLPAQPEQEIVFVSEEVVQPIEEAPGPAARTMQPPGEELAEAVPAPSNAGRRKLIRLQPAARAADKRVRTGG